MDKELVARFLEKRPGNKANVEVYQKIIEGLERHEIPETYPITSEFVLSEHELGLEAFFFRDRIIELSSFALLSYDWIRPLAQWIGECPCLEIMAGSGALSFALARCGVDIVATDSGLYLDKRPQWFSAPWCEVEHLGCLESIKKYAKERPLIICSWPDMNNMAYQSLLTMRTENPNAIMVYIGEGRGFFGSGATADEDFFEAAKLLSDPEFDKAITQYKQYTGIHDLPYLIK